MAAKNNDETSRPDMRLPRWLAAVFALSMIGLGMWSILSEHYFGRTDKLGGAEVTLDGQAAVLMGLLYISLGLLPLGLWFRSPGAAAWWASLCSVAFLGLLLASIYG